MHMYIYIYKYISKSTHLQVHTEYIPNELFAILTSIENTWALEDPAVSAMAFAITFASSRVSGFIYPAYTLPPPPLTHPHTPTHPHIDPHEQMKNYKCVHFY